MATAGSNRAIVANIVALARASATVPGMETVRLADSGFFSALLLRDIPALEQLLTPDFQIVDVTSGSLHRRASFLEVISERRVTFEQIQSFPLERTIRIEGPMAIVIGRTAMSFADAEGELTLVDSRYTHVFHGGAGNWRLASAQGTPIRSGGDS
jgi:ketosteroid isomerase-like protein